jgi:hypothetical protein
MVMAVWVLSVLAAQVDKPNFTGIRGDVHGVFGKGVKKRRLDVPSSSAGAVAQ